MSEQITKKKTKASFMKDTITSALVFLLGEKDFNDITVTEIADHAGISRMSYYRMFSSKEEVIAQFLQHKINGFKDSIVNKATLTKEELTESFYSIFSFFADHKILTDNILSKDTHQILSDHLAEFLTVVKTKIKGESASENTTDYEAQYQAGGIINMILQWLRDGQKESPLEMAKMVANMIYSSIAPEDK